MIIKMVLWTRKDSRAFEKRAPNHNAQKSGGLLNTWFCVSIIMIPVILTKGMTSQLSFNEQHAAILMFFMQIKPQRTSFINTFTYIAVSVVSFLAHAFSIDALGMVITIGAVQGK